MLKEKNITVSYDGEDGYATAVYKGKTYEFSLYEDDSDEYGGRYIEINDESGKTIATIQDAYNTHSVDGDNSYVSSIEKSIAEDIKEYLRSEM